jgi:ATP-dependent RNA helicase DbpA
MTAFQTLDLRPELLVGVDRLGWSEPTAIQREALPPALEGRDVVGLARTGTGKTAVFGLALLNKLDTTRRTPQALVLCPTRELAEQVTGALRALGAGMPGVRVLRVTGGSPSRDQKAALEAGAHVVVGTPGRVLQQLELGRLDPSALATLVLDEADRMLDMGFEEQVHAILELLPRERQTLLFSATWPPQMSELSGRIQNDPITVGSGDRIDPDLLAQSAVLCGWDQRDDALCGVLRDREPVPTLVFCETRAQCKEVATLLQRRGAAALALHGELEQRDRDEVLVRFRNGTARILVATNVAARGLDVEGIGLVICYEISPEPSVHLHRVGRTARAEATGEAVTIVAGDGKELRRLAAVDDFLGTPLPRTRPGPANDGPLDRWCSEWTTLVVFGGRRDKLRAGDVLGALTRAVGLDGTDVGKIVLEERRTWVAVRTEHAHRAQQGLDGTRIKKGKFRVRVVRKGEGVGRARPVDRRK